MKKSKKQESYRKQGKSNLCALLNNTEAMLAEISLPFLQLERLRQEDRLNSEFKGNLDDRVRPAKEEEEEEVEGGKTLHTHADRCCWSHVVCKLAEAALIQLLPEHRTSQAQHGSDIFTPYQEAEIKRNMTTQASKCHWGQCLFTLTIRERPFLSPYSKE